MTNRIEAWQCIGCGKLESPQPCIGVCQDQKVELVNADDLDRALLRINELEKLLRMLALSTPRDGQWEKSYLQFQAHAKRLLAKSHSLG